MIGTLSALSPLGGGLFLGYSLGANDAANVFGAAVAARIISFRNACITASLAVIAGAYFQGDEGIKTLSGITQQTIQTAFIISICAALTVSAMTYIKLPVSTSQAVVGAIFAIGFISGKTDYGPLIKIVLCWIGTPIGAMLISFAVYLLVGLFIDYVPMSILTRDKILWAGLFAAGIYGSYALGANNVTNSTGIFSGLIDGVSDKMLTIIGSIAISAGIITLSKRVIYTVGSGIIPMDAFTAFTAVLSMSITVHIFAFIGAPVSTSQAIVGAVAGVGIIKGNRSLHFDVLKRIAAGWLWTPVIAFILTASAYAVFVLRVR